MTGLKTLLGPIGLSIRFGFSLRLGGLTIMRDGVRRPREDEWQMRRVEHALGDAAQRPALQSSAPVSRHRDEVVARAILSNCDDGVRDIRGQHGSRCDHNAWILFVDALSNRLQIITSRVKRMLFRADGRRRR